LSHIRAEINKAIEPKRKDRVIGKPLDAMVTLFVDKKVRGLLESADLDICEFFIVSKVVVEDLSAASTEAFVAEEVEGLKIDVAPAPGEKCERCWRISEELGTDSNHPTACPRCTAVLKILG